MNEVNVAIASGHCLERVPRPWHREAELKKSPVDSLSQGGGAEIWERPRQLEFSGQNSKKKRATQRENTRDLQRILLDSSAGY